MNVSVFIDGFLDSSFGLDSGIIVVMGLQMIISMIFVNFGSELGFVYSSGLFESILSVLIGVGIILVIVMGGQYVVAWEIVIVVPIAVFISWSSDDLDEKINKKKDFLVTWVPGNGIYIWIDFVFVDGFGEKVNFGVMVVCELKGDSGSYMVLVVLLFQLDGGGDLFFNADYLVFGVIRIVLEESSFVDGGEVTVAVLWSGGGIVKLDK